jgi:hypothetical protein
VSFEAKVSVAASGQLRKATNADDAHVAAIKSERRGPAKQSARRSVFVVLLRLVRCRSFRVLDGNEMMSVRKMGVMPCFFVGTSLMVFGCLPMMTGSVFVMFGRLLMMLRTFVFGHFVTLSVLKN